MSKSLHPLVVTVALELDHEGMLTVGVVYRKTATA